jgi:AraC-like DNA-binding protein
MPYREIVPELCLRPFVDRFWVQTSAGAGGAGGVGIAGIGGFGDAGAAGVATPRSHRVLPDGCIDVLVHLGDDGATEIVGTMTSAIVVPGGPSEVAAVRFKPGGAAPLLGLPVAELTDRSVPLADLASASSGANGLELRHLMRAEGDSVLHVVAELQRRLLARLASSVGVPRPDATVAHAVARLFSESPPPMSELARELGWSIQHLRRLFLRHVGISPKELARVARLQRAVARLQRHRAESLASAAAALGYFDQAHMARDFRLLAGASPTTVRAEAGSIFPIQSLLARADLPP